MNGFMLFGGASSAGTELWRTDGTPGGTFLVKDIRPGSASSELRLYNSVVLNGVAYFVANDGTHGPEVWRSDGTTAGTWLVVDVTPGDEDRTKLLGPRPATGSSCTSMTIHRCCIRRMEPPPVPCS